MARTAKAKVSKKKAAAKKLRRNARPAIEGRWVSRRDLALAGLDALPKDAQADARALEERFAAGREATYEGLRAQDPEGYRWIGETLATQPRAKRSKGPPVAADVLREELVTDAFVNIDKLLDALVAFVNLTFEATIGVGPGGLFNFEHAAIERLLEVADDLGEQRRHARELVRWQEMLDALTGIYEETLKAWGPSGRIHTENDHLESPLNAKQRLADRAQREALKSFCEKFDAPLDRLDEWVRHPRAIKRNGAGSRKTAAGVLGAMRRGGSTSSIEKDRGRIGPLFEYRAKNDRFPLSSESEEVAQQFGRFAWALFLAAQGNPPFYVGRSLPEEKRREAIRSGNALHKNFLLASRFKSGPG